MSLFQTKRWWGFNVEGEDELDQDCLIHGDLSNTGQLQVSMGTFNGRLMVFKPAAGDYQPDHLLIEQNLGAPVLGMRVGHFLAAGVNSIAVLHPSCLAYYELATQAGASSLIKAHEHGLDHTAASLESGFFGGEAGVEKVVVQTMDGQLVFFQGKRRLFHRYLKSFLVPGPLRYLPPLDAFATASSAFSVELYTYQGLGEATSGESKGARDAEAQGAAAPEQGQGQAGTRGKDVAPRWAWTAGEGIVAIKWAPAVASAADRDDGGVADAIVLGERHLFVLTSTGQCRTQIKLDYHPTALAVVQTPAPITGVNYQVLVATHTGSLMVYRGSRLVWGAKSDMVPVALSTGAFGGTDGMILAADDRGRLAVLYMGTDPPLNVVQVVESKDLDFEAMDREHQELLAQIRDHTAGEGRGAVAERLLLRTHVPVACDAEDRHMHLSDPLGGGGREGRGAEPRTVTVTVHVSYEGRAPVRDVAVRVACPPTVACSPTEERIAEMRPGRGTPVTLRLRFTHTGAAVPPTSAVTVSATYETSKGEPRAVFASFRLPLALFAELVPPIKESAYKLVLDTNRAPPQLTALFDDMVAQSASLTSTASANVLSVRYACGADATVVVSRTGGRFRVQSDRFHAMWLLTEELCLRLHALFRGAGAAEGEEPFRIDFQEPLPLGDLFELMDQHLEARLAQSQLLQQLERRATQFRAVQKRLLVRFKDRNPEPLKHLDDLLHSTYRHLVELGKRAQELTDAIRARRWEMGAALRLIALLARLQHRLGDAEGEALEAFISPEALDARETSWEQVTQATMKWALSKQEGGAALSSGVLQAVEDTAELKSLVSAFIEKVGGGATFLKEL